MWNYSSCAVQGRGHMKNQVPCQDKAKTVFENGTYVAALADGAGSASLSQYGAATVVESITQLMVEHFEELYGEADGRLVKLRIMEKLITDLKAQAQLLDCSVKDLASTMLVVAINNDRYIIGHIGDGVIGYLDHDVLKVASAPDNGEYANETVFVTSREAIQTMRLFKGGIKNIGGFVLMSDGTEHSLYNKRTNGLVSAVLKLLRRNVLLDHTSMCSQLESTVRNVIATRTQDDCSIALIARKTGVLYPYGKYSLIEKCELFDMKREARSTGKRVARYDVIIAHLQKPTTCAALSRKLHLKPKYTKRHLDRLCALGLAENKNGVYHTGIIL